MYNMFKAHDHIDFEIYIQLYKVTHNHDNDIVFLKKKLQVWYVII